MTPEGTSSKKGMLERGHMLNSVGPILRQLESEEWEMLILGDSHARIADANDSRLCADSSFFNCGEPWKRDTNEDNWSIVQLPGTNNDDRVINFNGQCVLNWVRSSNNYWITNGRIWPNEFTYFRKGTCVSNCDTGIATRNLMTAAKGNLDLEGPAVGSDHAMIRVELMASTFPVNRIMERRQESLKRTQWKSDRNGFAKIKCDHSDDYNQNADVCAASRAMDSALQGQSQNDAHKAMEQWMSAMERLPMTKWRPQTTTKNVHFN